MKFQKISLDDLIVNPANDRHGELTSEQAAINWLLNHRAEHMRNLSKDIVREGKIYEPPLVHPDGDSYTVYDGNRRVTCLKLLMKPQKAPTAEWSAFYSGLRQSWNGQFPDKIDCQIEPDRDQLDEILFRRHTGGKSGVGQSRWDPEAKSNFERRTGKKTKVNVAEEIENLLKENGTLDGNKKKLPRSNLNRLLSNEAFRNRVGISIKNNRLVFTHDKSKVFTALTRIANDLISGTLVLEGIWNENGKITYLDSLDNNGILPSADDLLPGQESHKVSKIKSKLKPPQNVKRTLIPNHQIRKTLIRNIDYGLTNQAHTQRAMDIWQELQYRLKFDDHMNAIAVLFRVLLEFSIENYINRKEIDSVHINDKLSKKFSKVLSEMKDSDDIDNKYYSILKKFENSDPLFSANTLHGYVHHKDFYPSDSHLKSMWDTLSSFVVICLRA